MKGRELTTSSGNPKPQTLRNITDPDSHILKESEGWVQGYNAQAAFDGVHQVSWPSASATRPARDASGTHAGLDLGQRRPDAGSAQSGCWLLQHHQPRCLQATWTGCLNLHQPQATRHAATTIAGPNSQRPRYPRANGPQAQIKSWPGGTRQ